MWEIWLERNKRTFEGKQRSEEEIWRRIKLLVIESLRMTIWGEQDMKVDPTEKLILRDWEIHTLPTHIGTRCN